MSQRAEELSYEYPAPAASSAAELAKALEASATEAIFWLRAAQAYIGGERRFRGRHVTTEGLERAAARLYEALDRAQGRAPWPTCPDCGERVRSFEAHAKGCAKNRKADAWE